MHRLKIILRTSYYILKLFIFLSKYFLSRFILYFCQIFNCKYLLYHLHLIDNSYRLYLFADLAPGKVFMHYYIYLTYVFIFPYS